MKLNKKGEWETYRSLPASIIGLILLAMGLLPLLNQFGVITLNLPYTPAGLVLAIILTIGGGWLMISGFLEEDFLKFIGITMGLFVLVLGVLPILAQMGILLPIAFLGFLYSPYLYAIVGFLLIIAAFAVQ
ncbi:MAG: hypothetical protein KAQ83_02745 [Nanoarchaeota archaeon]|nr:hypothetical protein [Nanoarchaeota archaeon]